MPPWRKEKKTDDLRWLRYLVKSGPAPFDVKIERRLQQKWIVTVGTGSGFKDVEEWRDIPVVSEG
jgi:hypothetical protein